MVGNETVRRCYVGTPLHTYIHIYTFLRTVHTFIYSYMGDGYGGGGGRGGGVGVAFERWTSTVRRSDARDMALPQTEWAR